MKKMLSFMLAIIMVFSLLPTAVFAAEVPSMHFETTFTEEKGVGDTFTVTYYIDSNPGFNSFCFPLSWNENVVEFNGFNEVFDEDNEEDVLETTALSAFSLAYDHDYGIVTGARANDVKKTGMAFIANFTIIGSGNMELGFVVEDLANPDSQFQMGNNAGDDLTEAAAAAIDYSAIANLSVAGAEPDGPVIPDGAPFTAITTDAGAVIAIEQQENVSFNYADVPYYIVTIPADVTTVYVTDPNQVVMQDYTSGEMKASAYAADIAGGWSQLYVNYDYTEVADGIQVTIPLNMTAEDWSVGTVEMCFVDDGNGSLTHAYGSEDSSYACTFLMSFKYAASSAPVEPEEPTVSEIPEGAAFVDLIARVNGEDKPVTITYVGDDPSYGMGPLYKVEVPLGTTSVYAVYNEGDVYVDDFGYAKTVHIGWDNVQSDGYAQSTQNGKTTVGLMMEKAAANGSGTLKLLNIPYNEEELRYVGLSDSTDTRYHFFAFTYELGEGQYFASLPSNHMYAVTGDGVASDGYTFNVYILNGYEATENFAVLVNGKIVATEPGDITIESVTEDLIITVEGVTQSYNPATDVCIILDLTEYTGPINGEMWCNNKNGQNSTITLTAGKKHTMSLAASDIWQMYCNIYSIGSNVVGYDINGETRDPGESGYLSFGFNVRDNAEPGLYVIKPILSGEAPEEPNPEEPEEPEVTFPITITVDGEPVTATYEGTEYSNMAYTDVPKFVAKVPAGTTAFTVSHPDGIMMSALANGNFLAQGETSCTVTLSGNAGYVIADGGFGFLGHLYIEIEEGSEPEEPTTYTITAQQPTGGTVTVLDQDGNEITQAEEGDAIFLQYEADEGYQFKHYLINGVAVTEAELGMTNGFYTMPGEDITISAVFEAIHTCAYDQENVADKYLKSEATCQSGAVYYKSCTCGEFATTAETFVFGEAVDHVYVDDVCKWCGEAAEVEPEPEEPVVTPGYRFATSADVSTEKDDTAVVRVKVTGHSDENVTTYHAYDLTLTFDTEKLEYVSCAGAVVTDGGEVKVEGNTIRIVGCGAAKEFGTEIAALTFKTKTEGSANVTIDKVQVSDQEDAVTQDIPEATAKHDENDTTADTTPNESVIVVPFSVTKPDFVSGNDKVVAGDDYTFSFTDTDNYTYSELKVTVGGIEVTPSEADGVYTIENVTGAIVIEATKTANSYNVIKPENVTGPDKATYGTDYVFTVTPDEGKEIDSVKATIGGEEIAVTKNTEGAYVIAGGNISGEITITVIQKDVEVPEAKYTNISFSGITEAEIEGGLTQKAEAGKDFTFKLIKTEGVTYTAKIGEEVLTANEDGSYTIPAAKMIEGNLTVTIEKAENINVDVTEYIKLDGQSMFLITAKSAVEGSASVLKYGDDVMYTSAKYNAYSWLVISAESAEAVKAAAETAITIAEAGSIAPAVAYGYDVNGTSKVDVNDAQLVYDMYNASYDAFTENLTVKKFLEADADGSTNLGTQDVATIINYIVNQNA